MSMKAMEDLRDKLCEELDEVARKPEMGAGDLELAHKLTDTIKNIDKIRCIEEDGGYSQAGDWEMEGRGTYGRGSSYANRGKHYVRGHYSRDDGRGDMDGDYSSRRDSRGRYSRDGGAEAMMEHLRQAMAAAGDDRERDAIRRMMENLEG